MPSAPASSATTPTRRPSTPAPRLAGARRAGGSARQVESSGSWPGDHVEEQRGVGHRGGEGADLVERAGEGDQAVARHHAVGGLDAHHPAQGGGLADGPSGVGTQGQRRETGGDRGGAAPPEEPPGTRSGAGVAGGAESRVLRGPAHGELVEVGLAHETAPAAAGGAPRWRRRAAANRRGCATSRWSASPGCKGCPSRRPAHRPAGPGPRRRLRASISAAARAGLVRRDQVEGVDVGLAFGDPGQVLLEHVEGGAAPADVSGDSCPARPSCSWRLSQDPGDAEAVVFDFGGLGQDLVPVEAGPGYVLAEDVDQRERMRRRLDSLDVERGDVGRMVEDRSELGRVAFEFLLDSRGAPGERRGRRRRWKWAGSLGHRNTGN